MVPARDGVFGFRDPRAGLPPPPLEERDADELARALADVRGGRPAEARRRLTARLARTKAPLAFELALVYAGLAETAGASGDDPAGRLDPLVAGHPGWLAAVEARADLLLARQSLRGAWEAYRAALRIAPRDGRLLERAESVRRQLVLARRKDGDEALAASDVDAARKAALSLLELDPASPAGSMLLARIAAASGRFEDAYQIAREVRARVKGDAAFTEMTAELAQKTGRHAEAAELLDELARRDPAFAVKAEEARLDFRIQNLPEAARRAAQSPRLTRSQLAVLAWWTVPEVRAAQPLGPPEVAVDVVDRPDRVMLVRAIGLGLLTVSHDTHRVGVDVGVTRQEVAVALRRLAQVAAGGRAVGGCLAAESPTPAALAECGILLDGSTRGMTGREALRAVERAARLAREGVSR